MRVRARTEERGRQGEGAPIRSGACVRTSLSPGMPYDPGEQGAPLHAGYPAERYRKERSHETLYTLTSFYSRGRVPTAPFPLRKIPASIDILTKLVCLLTSALPVADLIRSDRFQTDRGRMRRHS